MQIGQTGSLGGPQRRQKSHGFTATQDHHFLATRGTVQKLAQPFQDFLGADFQSYFEVYVTNVPLSHRAGLAAEGIARSPYLEQVR